MVSQKIRKCRLYLLDSFYSLPNCIRIKEIFGSSVSEYTRALQSVIQMNAEKNAFIYAANFAHEMIQIKRVVIKIATAKLYIATIFLMCANYKRPSKQKTMVTMCHFHCYVVQPDTK